MTDLNNEIDSKLEKLLKETFQIEKISLDFSMEDIPEWDSFKHCLLYTSPSPRD